MTIPFFIFDIVVHTCTFEECAIISKCNITAYNERTRELFKSRTNCLQRLNLSLESLRSFLFSEKALWTSGHSIAELKYFPQILPSIQKYWSLSIQARWVPGPGFVWHYPSNISFSPITESSQLTRKSNCHLRILVIISVVSVCVYPSVCVCMCIFSGYTFWTRNFILLYTHIFTISRLILITKVITSRSRSNK